MIALVQQKKLTINFSKANTQFFLILHYNEHESYLYVNKTMIYKFKAKDSINWYNFGLGSVSQDLQKMNRAKLY